VSEEESKKQEEEQKEQIDVSARDIILASATLTSAFLFVVVILQTIYPGQPFAILHFFLAVSIVPAGLIIASLIYAIRENNMKAASRCYMWGFIVFWGYLFMYLIVTYIFMFISS